MFCKIFISSFKKPKAKTSWADLPDLTVSVSWNLIRRSVKVGEGMMEPPPLNHSTHPEAGAEKKKKPEPENTKVWDWLHKMEREMLARYKGEEEDVITIDSD